MTAAAEAKADIDDSIKRKSLKSEVLNLSQLKQENPPIGGARWNAAH